MPTDKYVSQAQDDLVYEIIRYAYSEEKAISHKTIEKLVGWKTIGLTSLGIMSCTSIAVLIELADTSRTGIIRQSPYNFIARRPLRRERETRLDCWGGHQKCCLQGRMNTSAGL